MKPGLKVSRTGKLFEQFRTKTLDNPRISTALLKRRFEFVNLLEGGLYSPRLDPNYKEVEADAPETEITDERNTEDDEYLPSEEQEEEMKATDAFTVTWDDIVKRMVKYGNAHLYDSEQEHCIRIFETLKYHLISARSDLDQIVAESLGKSTKRSEFEAIGWNDIEYEEDESTTKPDLEVEYSSDT